MQLQKLLGRLAGEVLLAWGKLDHKVVDWTQFIDGSIAHRTPRLMCVGSRSRSSPVVPLLRDLRMSLQTTSSDMAIPPQGGRHPNRGFDAALPTRRWRSPRRSRDLDQVTSRIALAMTIPTRVAIEAGSLMSVVKANVTKVIVTVDHGQDKHREVRARICADTQVSEADDPEDHQRHSTPDRRDRGQGRRRGPSR
jgi:hypothetical protein